MGEGLGGLAEDWLQWDESRKVMKRGVNNPLKYA